MSETWFLEREAERAAAHVRPRRITWAWRDILPAGMVSVVAGAPGSKKSLLAALVAAELSQQSEVIFGNAEDPVEEVQLPRLVAADAVLERVTFWSPDLDDVVALSQLEYQIGALGVRLLVLDPLSAHVTPSRAGLLPLARVAKRTGCAILGLHHTVKGGFGDPLTRIAGSTAGALGTARAVYVLGPHPEAAELESALAPVKVNVGPPPRALSFALQRRSIRHAGFRAEVPLLRLVNESAGVTAREILDGPPAPSGHDIAAAAEWLTGYLRHGERPVAEVFEDAAALGVGALLLQASADLLGIVEKPGRRGRWRLPSDHPLAS